MDQLILFLIIFNLLFIFIDLSIDRILFIVLGTMFLFIYIFLLFWFAASRSSTAKLFINRLGVCTQVVEHPLCVEIHVFG